MLDVAQGYELQSAVARLRCERGENIIGYKVGCTSPTIRTQLGIDHCVSGRLYDSEQHASGTTLSRGRFANLAIEGELAVQLAREPNADDFSEIAIPPCVARVFPVIELHNHVMRGHLMRGQQPSAGELIANNAIHAGFVAGSGPRSDASERGRPLELAGLSICSDDQLLAKCGASALVQTIHSSLQWLADVLRDRGDRLRAEQIVLTGSIPNLFPIADDCRIRVEAPPVGGVEVRFVP